MKNNCKKCGKPFNDTAHPSRKYCSKKCWNSGRPHKPIEERFWKRVKKTDTCWLWTGKPKNTGYGELRIKKGKNIDTHRLSWQIHFGPIPPGMYVLHKCDVRNCVNPAHLFLGTHLDNIKDMVSKGRHRFGKTRISHLSPTCPNTH